MSIGGTAVRRMIRRQIGRMSVALLAISCIAAASPAASASGSTAAFDRSIEQARQTAVTAPERALKLVDQLYHAAGSHPDRSYAEAKTLRIRSESLLRLGRVKEAGRSILHASRLAETTNASALKGEVALTRGAIDAENGDVAQSLSNYQIAFRHFVTAGEERGQALSLIAIASLYREAADYDRALQYFGQAIEAYPREPLFSLSIYNNRGNVLTDMLRYPEAIRQFEAALSLVDDQPGGAGALEGRIRLNLARAERKAGRIVEARRSIARARAAFGSDMPRAALNQVMGEEAHLALEGGNIGRALRLIEPAFAGVDLRTTPIAMRGLHSDAYAVYRAAGQTQRALEHLEALNRLDEQAVRLATSTKTALMAAQFDFQNQELRITRMKAEELRRNVEFERSRARYQRILFGSIAAAVAVLIAVLIAGIVVVGRSRNRERASNIALARTNRALERALTAKTEFLATTSHEIRTPLNGILGMTQVMLADRALPAEVREHLDIVHGAGLTMKSLVDDILDVAKMEAGNLEVELIPTDLRAVIRDVAKLWELQAAQRGLSFAVRIDPALPQRLSCDPGRLRQIVFNLLSNAAKFTSEGGIALEVDAAGDAMTIAVRDTGMGIAPDKLGQIFESFRQADASTTRRFGGTGLGLTISRNLARALGGDIAVESRVGEGSVFTVSLPLRRVEPSEDAGKCTDPAECGLLILDRNPIARGMMRTLFEPHAGRLVFADDAADLSSQIRRGGVARILVDGALLGADVDGMLGRIADDLVGSDAHGIVLIGPDAPEPRVAGGGRLRILRRPVSGAVLVEHLFGGETDGITGLVSRAA